MGRLRSGAGGVFYVLLVFSLGAPAHRAAAQAPASSPAPPRPTKSVYGKLQTVDKTRKGVVMLSDTGQRLAWRFSTEVIEELSHYKPGDPMIVIYRMVSAKDKRVTAVAFPGTAQTPTYVNMTGTRVVLRSSPGVNGACGVSDAGPISESTLPESGVAEVAEACWCCAPAGETCSPGNKSGLGKALLVTCFN
jgi:hypothetical protein